MLEPPALLPTLRALSTVEPPALDAPPNEANEATDEVAERTDAVERVEPLRDEPNGWDAAGEAEEARDPGVPKPPESCIGGPSVPARVRMSLAIDGTGEGRPRLLVEEAVGPTGEAALRAGAGDAPRRLGAGDEPREDDADGPGRGEALRLRGLAGDAPPAIGRCPGRKPGGGGPALLWALFQPGGGGPLPVHFLAGCCIPAPWWTP